MNEGTLIAAQVADLASEEAHFSAPETVRATPIRCTDEIEAFQACVAALDCWGMDEPITGWDMRLMASTIQYDAQSAYLRRLAAF